MTIICCAYPFGYGPAAKLILVARRLRARGFATVFIGEGIAHELASRSDAFSEVIEGGGHGGDVRARIAGARALLSVMERDLSRVAVEVGTPLYVIDSLRWQRETVPEPFGRAARCWAQRFAPGDAGVGPIVEPMAPRTAAGLGVLVSLGGYESPHGGVTDDASYCDFVMRGLLGSELLAAPGGVTLLAGARCVAHLRAAFPQAQGRIALASVSHAAALELLAGAARVVTSPGLTTTLECFQLGVPTLFLPPQNYSQWRTLRQLDRLELSGGAFGWWDAMAGAAEVEGAAEAERTPCVRRVIARLAGTDAARAGFAASLQRWWRADPRALGERQRAYFAALGDNGADQIAGELAAACAEAAA